MHRLAESKLLAGFIYGDPHMQEYIYLPGSELDAASPMLVYETGKERHDVDMQEALSLVEKRSLKPGSHPVFGKQTMGCRLMGAGFRVQGRYENTAFPVSSFRAQPRNLYCTTVISTYAPRKDDAHCLTCGNGHSAIEISRQRFQ